VKKLFFVKILDSFDFLRLDDQKQSVRFGQFVVFQINYDEKNFKNIKYNLILVMSSSCVT